MSGLFSGDAKKLFADANEVELCEALEVTYREYQSRILDEVVYGNRAELTFEKHTQLNCLALRQTALHRAERLFFSAGSMLEDANAYGLSLVVRGHFESTAVLGYLCNRLDSLVRGNIKLEDFEWDVADALMGARHQAFSKARPALNILTCIEKADKYLDAKFKQKRGMLRDCYDWLSEFCHPNFASNMGAFDLDKKNGKFLFVRGGQVRKEDFQLFGYLDICGRLFVQLFDSFAEAEAQANLE